MNKLTCIAIAALAALFVASFAIAAPGIAITKTAPLSGTGSPTDPLKLTVCANGEVYQSNGTSWACTTAGAGDITSVGATADMGLTGGAVSGAALLGLRSTCTDGQVLKSGASGTSWTCNDDDNNQYTAGDGIALTAGEFDLDVTADFELATGQLDLSGAVTAPGTVVVAGAFSAGGATLTELVNFNHATRTLVRLNKATAAIGYIGTADALFSGGASTTMGIYSIGDLRLGADDNGTADLTLSGTAGAFSGALTIAGHTTTGDTNADTTTAWGHVVTQGTAPALTSCGGSPTIVGTDFAATVDPDDNAACTLTFSRTFTSVPVCVVSVQSGNYNAWISASSATAVTVTQNATSEPFDIICVGRTAP